jgi:hypothetical protein
VETLVIHTAGVSRTTAAALLVVFEISLGETPEKGTRERRDPFLWMLQTDYCWVHDAGLIVAEREHGGWGNEGGTVRGDVDFADRVHHRR